jgi:hypothetical protein
MRHLTAGTLMRNRVAIETSLLVVGVVILKLIVNALSGEFIVLGPLYTSIVGGGIFVIGLIVAGTLADYKESEKMPAEIASALVNILGIAKSVAKTTETFDLVSFQKALIRVVTTFKEDLADPSSRRCLVAIQDLSPYFVELERLGLGPLTVMRLWGEQATIRKTLLRVYHIQRTEFLPSAYILIQTIMFLIIGALVFTKVERLYGSVVILALLSYFFIYLVKLLKIIDTPFRADQHTKDSVSLFLLDEFAREAVPERVENPTPGGSVGDADTRA